MQAWPAEAAGATQNWAASADRISAEISKVTTKERDTVEAQIEAKPVEDGCQIRLTRFPGTETVNNVLTFWDSRQDFLNWVRSDAFVKGHAQSGTLPKEAYPQPNVLEMHEVVSDSSRPQMEPEPHGGPFKMH